MRGKKVSILAAAVLGFLILSEAQAQAPAPNPGQIGDLVNCADYYKPGTKSVTLSTQTDKISYLPGEAAILRGKIKNTSAYPLSGVSIYARILKNHPKPNKYADKIILDEFYLAENFNLAAGEERELTGGWLVSPKAGAGEYEAVFYVVLAQKFSLAGFLETDYAVASFSRFEVKGKNSEAIYLDRANAKLDGVSYSFKAPMVQPLDLTKPHTVSIPLSNPGKVSEKISITYKLFSSLNLNPKNLLKESSETMTIAAGSSKTLTYKIQSGEAPHYYLQITAKTARLAKSLVNISLPFSMSRGEIVYLGVSRFPLKTGSTYTLFGCFRNAAPGAGTSEDGRFVATLKDRAGSVVASLDFPGAIAATQGIKTTFQPAENYDYLSLEAAVFDRDERAVDVASLKYDCKTFAPSNCLGEGTVPSLAGGGGRPTLPLVAVAFLLFVIVFALIAIIKRRSSMGMTM